MGGPRVTPRTEKFIVDIWISLKKEGKEATAPQVLEACNAYIKSKNRDDIFLPKIRKITNIIGAARKKYSNLPPEEVVMQEPWSMASLDKYPLPLESIPIVAQIWRYTLISGEPFTIRQAKWASRVCMFERDPVLIWLSSYEYAKKEEAAIISQKPFDSFNDDMRLVFTTLEALTIWKIKYNDQPFADPFSTSIPRSTVDDGIMQEVLHPVDYYNALYNNTVTNKRDMEFNYLLSKMPSIGSIKEIGSEFKVVYLIWVNRIKQMPEWQNILAEEAIDIIQKLREWAVNQQAIKEDFIKQGTSRIAAKIKDNQVFVSDKLPTPNEVLNLLTKYSEKGAQNARTHSKKK